MWRAGEPASISWLSHLFTLSQIYTRERQVYVMCSSADSSSSCYLGTLIAPMPVALVEGTFKQLGKKMIWQVRPPDSPIMRL
jgi:hypothetical protein